MMMMVMMTFTVLTRSNGENHFTRKCVNFLRTLTSPLYVLQKPTFEQ